MIGDDILIVSVPPERITQTGTPATIGLDSDEPSLQYGTGCVQRCPAMTMYRFHYAEHFGMQHDRQKTSSVCSDAVEILSYFGSSEISR